MEENENIFDLLDPERKKSGNGWALFAACGLIVVAFGSSIYLFLKNPRGTQATSPVQSSQAVEKVPAANKGYEDYVNFAERFYVSAFNLNYSNYTEQVSKAAQNMSPELSDYYKADFLDTGFRQKILLRKMYVTFQKTDHSQVEAVSGDQVVVRVSGDNFINSDLDGSQIQLHNSMLISVVKKGDSFQVVNFCMRI